MIYLHILSPLVPIKYRTSVNESGTAIHCGSFQAEHRTLLQIKNSGRLFLWTQNESSMLKYPPQSLKHSPIEHLRDMVEMKIQNIGWTANQSRRISECPDAKRHPNFERVLTEHRRRGTEAVLKVKGDQTQF